MAKKRSCIVFSQGPVPAPEHDKVEGGGLRCWGLAKGIHDNEPGIDVTIAYHESYKKDGFTEAYQGVNITTWNIDTVAGLCAGHDTVLVSYCMGPLSVMIADTIRPDQQLILDCNVPIYVEASARETSDIEKEYAAFEGDVLRWAHVLKRGDVFLCASEAQKNYYKGVLSGVGRINPVTYKDDMIKVVPYGIYRDKPVPTEKPISRLVKDKKIKKILWFGGIYPWFDLRFLVEAVKQLNQEVPAKLVIVGAKNPFNNHPDFVKTYEELIKYIEEDEERKSNVILQDWVEFDKRADWYLDSDIVVVANKLGEENKLAWRTRLVDFLWADLPIITNGGDPLGETLLAHGAAARFGELTADGLKNDLAAILKDDSKLKTMRDNLASLRPKFYWDSLTSELAELVSSHQRASDLSAYGQYTINPVAGGSKLHKVRSAASKAKMIPAYAQKHGAKNTYYAIRTKVRNRLGTKIGIARTKPGIVMIAHQLDFSGAPYVFMDLAEDIIKSSNGIPIEFHSFNPSLKENLTRLNRLGIKPNLHISKDIEIPYVNGDVMVLNTVAHSAVLKHSIYAGLESGRLKQLAWFIHEDEPELIFADSEITRIKKLLGKDKIIMYVAAKKTLHNYQKVFENQSNIRLQPYKYLIPETYQKVRQESDFDKLSFILPGTVGDGRKGQLPVFYALADFYTNRYQVSPNKYRDFELVFVGITDDFLSRQILKHASLLGNRFKHYGRVTHERSSELMMASNMTVCYSLRECLPLFVFEGMAAGHPILRNDSSGIDEQLFEGKNGFYLDSKDYTQIVETFDRVLNKTKTSNKQLADMSIYSNEVALAQAKNSYEPMVSAILGHLK